MAGMSEFEVMLIRYTKYEIKQCRITDATTASEMIPDAVAFSDQVFEIEVYS